MRSPTDVPPRPRRIGRLSRRFWIGLAVVVVLVLFFSLHSLAMLWTNEMWFSSVGLASVFSTLFWIKVSLAVTFGVIFFFLLWGNLILTDRFGARDLTFAADDEVVRRFQNAVRPFAKRVYAVIALFAALIAGVNASGQWQSFLLFSHYQSFHKTDPLFHKDIGFYVFTLPFLGYLVRWFLVVLIITFILTSIFHYLNGGIRPAKSSPRVSPRVKAHLSVIGAAIALVKAGGYLVAKWSLVTSVNGFVEGAGYTDTHARIPALSILFWISIAAAIILLANLRSRGWSLPLLAVGLWAFVSLVIGVLYPTFLQMLKVGPNQQTLEQPYIQRNIEGTRAAFGLNKVKYHSLSATNTVTASEVTKNQTTLDNIRLWDPSPNIALQTVIRRQAIHGYYTFTSLGVDRYYINGKLTPVLIGTRQLNEAGLPSQSWVNQHLQYTHGIGVAVLAANQVDSSTGNPIFDVSDVPPTSSNGLPKLTQPDIYFGINMPGWVVANTKQPELDYQASTGSDAGQPIETHYQGGGGVAVGGIFSRIALALRLGDFNFLISNQIDSQSRVLFRRDVLQMAKSAAPFLSFDSQPYAVIANGEVDYVLDGYTTSANYPYSENADTLGISTGGLPSSFNYVRNSVKVVINAYTGKMTFYAMDPNDPILKAYRSAFPMMFHPLSSMPETIREHLRYPQDIFSVQAATLGRYHITNASAFYSASDRWTISPTTGAGKPSSVLSRTAILNSVGEIVSTQLSPMSPVYQVGALPEQTSQQLLELTDFVPAGAQSTVQSLSAMMIATSDPTDYGDLNVYITPRTGATVIGPVQADSEIQQTTKVSSTITLLDQHGSEVMLGNNITVPVGQSVLYVRPLYVSSSANPLPQLRFIITVFNQKVGIASTLHGALEDVLGSAVSGTSPSSSSKPTSSSSTVEGYLQQAANDYAAAETALKSGDLATYQKDVEAMDRAIQSAIAAGSTSTTKGAGSSTSGTTTTSTTMTSTTTTTTP